MKAFVFVTITHLLTPFFSLFPAIRDSCGKLEVNSENELTVNKIMQCNTCLAFAHSDLHYLVFSGRVCRTN